MNGIQRHGHGPNPAEILKHADARARAGATAAKNASLAIVRAEAPGSFRGDSMTASASKTPTGYKVVVQPKKTKRHIAKWVNQGTGIYGPKGKPIRRRKKNAIGHPKPFVFNGRAFATIKGQKPNRFIERSRPRAAAAAERAMTSEADHAR